MKFIFFIYVWIVGNICKQFPNFTFLQTKGSTSIINVYRENQIVTKNVLLYHQFNVIENEIKWLKVFSDFENVPQFISVDKTKITMSYAGEVLHKNNIPLDWEDQMEGILQKLKNANCSHNDIKPSDILVNNGILMLIDFQWATETDKGKPHNWPTYIGRRFKKDDGNYDDRYSLRKSILSVID